MTHLKSALLDGSKLFSQVATMWMLQPSKMTHCSTPFISFMGLSILTNSEQTRESPPFLHQNDSFLSIQLRCAIPYLYPLLSLHAEKASASHPDLARKVLTFCSAGCAVLLQPILSPPSSAPLWLLSHLVVQHFSFT